ncbi:hypothetical protein BSLG_005860 [Batrachochytrium salamandrivorans]|nr:hypothetical protein BSLG_005860 [Batrachochytrium salamandrivorans]
MDYSTCSQLNDAEQFCSSNTAVHQQFAQPLSEQQFIPYIASVELPSADTTALADGCHQLVHSQAILTSINLNGHAGIDHNGHLQAHSPDITMLTSPTTGITHLSHAAGLSGGIHNADTGNANCMLMVDPISPVHAGMTSETMTQMLPAIVVTTDVPYDRAMQFMYGGPAESPIAPVQMTWDMSSSLFPSYSNMNSSVVAYLLLPQPLQQIQTGIGHNPLSFQQSDEQGLLARARFPELYQHIPFQHYDSFNHQRSFSMPHTVAASDLLMDPNSFTFPSGSHESQSHIAPFFQQLPLLPQQSNQSQHSSLSMTSSEDTLDHRLYHTPWLLNSQHVPPITVDPNYIGTNHSNYLASATLPSSVSSFLLLHLSKPLFFLLIRAHMWTNHVCQASYKAIVTALLCFPVSKISRTHSSPPLPQKETISASRPESIFSDSDSDSCFNVDNDLISVATAAAQLQIKSTASLERPATKSKKFTYSEMTPCANILCQETFKMSTFTSTCSTISCGRQTLCM